MSSFIWNEKFWLPPNVTWDLMKEINSAGVSPTLTKSMDCFYAVAVLTAIRYYLKEYVGLQVQFFYLQVCFYSSWSFTGVALP